MQSARSNQPESQLKVCADQLRKNKVRMNQIKSILFSKKHEKPEPRHGKLMSMHDEKF